MVRASGHCIFREVMEGAGGNVPNASSTFVGASVGGKQVAEQEQEGRAVVLGESDSEDDVDGVASIRKRGRPSGSIWSYFTNDDSLKNTSWPFASTVMCLSTITRKVNLQKFT